MSDKERSDLVTQTEARELARYLNEHGPLRAIAGMVAIAVPYPFDSWGGHEQGWTVGYVPEP